MSHAADIREKNNVSLRRVLGLTTAILLVAGNIIGTGVFKKIVPMAATGMSEGQILTAWLAAGIITLLGAFTMAGLAKMTTASGGLYEYMRLSFGRFAGFILGWTGFSISLSGSIAAIAFIFAQSVNAIIPIPDPLHHLANISIADFIFPFANSGIKFVAIATIILLTWYNYRGIKKGAGLNNIVTALKILGIILLIVAGLVASASGNDVSQVSIQHYKIGEAGFFSAFFAAALSAFWAYDGFTNVTYITGEIKRPKRNLPIAIISGVCMVIVLYMLINYAYMQGASVKQLGALGENQIAGSYIAGKLMGKTGHLLISLLIMLSSFGTLNVIIIFYARLYYRMAQENMFFRRVAKVHPVFRTPYISLIVSMAWSIVLVFSGTFDMLTDMSVFVSFIFYALLAFALIKMKTKKTIKEKIPGYPWAPLIFIIFVIFLSINTLITKPKLSITGIGLVAIGIPFYFYFKWKYKGLPTIKEESEELTGP
ncbi:MAG: amino acid permease [Chitinophagaceae bacterium]|nr:MAG: amino acid permease [Chitinophagaceae bacterium]